MNSPITLQYPNGRVHEAVLETSAELKPGHQFDLHGRHWNAVELIKLPRGKMGEQQRMLCRSRSPLVEG
jgi:hypothetical protein